MLQLSWWRTERQERRFSGVLEQFVYIPYAHTLVHRDSVSSYAITSSDLHFMPYCLEAPADLTQTIVRRHCFKSITASKVSIRCGHYVYMSTQYKQCLVSLPCRGTCCSAIRTTDRCPISSDFAISTLLLLAHLSSSCISTGADSSNPYLLIHNVS